MSIFKKNAYMYVPRFALQITRNIIFSVMSTIISRNTPVPSKKTQIFSTAADNQETVSIQIFEGERPMTKDNHLLGKFDLNGIPPAARGIPQIEVTFEIDSNGIMKVSAKDKGTQKENRITISNDNNRLTPEEIQKMMDDAEKFADEDKKIKERTEAKNSLEQYSYTLKRQLDNKEEKLGQKISPEDKESILKIIQEKLDWLIESEEATTNEFNEARKAIEDVAQPIITKLYKDGQQENDEL